MWIDRSRVSAIAASLASATVVCATRVANAQTLPPVAVVATTAVSFDAGSRRVGLWTGRPGRDPSARLLCTTPCVQEFVPGTQTLYAGSSLASPRAFTLDVPNGALAVRLHLSRAEVHDTFVDGGLLVALLGFLPFAASLAVDAVATTPPSWGTTVEWFSIGVMASGLIAMAVGFSLPRTGIEYDERLVSARSRPRVRWAVAPASNGVGAVGGLALTF